MRKFLSLFVLAIFSISCIMPPQGFAQSITALGLMPKPGMMAGLTEAYTPSYLQGMKIDPNNPFQFDFMIYRGDENLTAEEKQAEYPKLVKYFLAALAVPDTDQWVNLSPYEKDRIIPDNFGSTEMGRDLLAQDYLLKQIASSLTNPDTALGKKFWDEVYTRSYQKFGTTDIPTDTFNKVWVMPDKAVIYEKDNAVMVLEQHLKVMLDTDYTAMANNRMPAGGHVAPQGYVSPSPLPSESQTALTNQVMREVIIPAIEKEVNEGKSFAPVRQVYSGMLLATWYKMSLKESIMGKLYVDQGKVKGIDQDPKNNQRIYGKYVEAFQKGVFNMIREDVDRFSQEVIPRKYFSGGFKGFDQRIIAKARWVQAQQVLSAAKDAVKKVKAGDAGALSYDRAQFNFINFKSLRKTIWKTSVLVLALSVLGVSSCGPADRAPNYDNLKINKEVFVAKNQERVNVIVSQFLSTTSSFESDLPIVSLSGDGFDRMDPQPKVQELADELALLLKTLPDEYVLSIDFSRMIGANYYYLPIQRIILLLMSQVAQGRAREVQEKLLLQAVDELQGELNNGGTSMTYAAFGSYFQSILVSGEEVLSGEVRRELQRLMDILTESINEDLEASDRSDISGAVSGKEKSDLLKETFKKIQEFAPAHIELVGSDMPDIELIGNALTIKTEKGTDADGEKWSNTVRMGMPYTDEQRMVMAFADNIYDVLIFKNGLESEWIKAAGPDMISADHVREARHLFNEDYLAIFETGGLAKIHWSGGGGYYADESMPARREFLLQNVFLNSEIKKMSGKWDINEQLEKLKKVVGEGSFKYILIDKSGQANSFDSAQQFDPGTLLLDSTLGGSTVQSALRGLSLPAKKALKDAVDALSLKNERDRRIFLNYFLNNDDVTGGSYRIVQVMGFGSINETDRDKIFGVLIAGLFSGIAVLGKSDKKLRPLEDQNDFIAYVQNFDMAQKTPEMIMGEQIDALVKGINGLSPEDLSAKEEDVLLALERIGFSDEKTAVQIKDNFIAQFERRGLKHEVAVAAAYVLLNRLINDRYAAAGSVFLKLGPAILALPFLMKMLQFYKVILTGEFYSDSLTDAYVDAYGTAHYVAGGAMTLGAMVMLWQRYKVRRAIKSFVETTEDKRAIATWKTGSGSMTIAEAMKELSLETHASLKGKIKEISDIVAKEPQVFVTRMANDKFNVPGPNISSLAGVYDKKELLKVIDILSAGFFDPDRLFGRKSTEAQALRSEQQRKVFVAYIKAYDPLDSAQNDNTVFEDFKRQLKWVLSQMSIEMPPPEYYFLEPWGSMYEFISKILANESIRAKTRPATWQDLKRLAYRAKQFADLKEMRMNRYIAFQKALFGAIVLSLLFAWGREKISDKKMDELQEKGRVNQVLSQEGVDTLPLSPDTIVVDTSDFAGKTEVSNTNLSPGSLDYRFWSPEEKTWKDRSFDQGIDALLKSLEPDYEDAGVIDRLFRDLNNERIIWELGDAYNEQHVLQVQVNTSEVGWERFFGGDTQDFYTKPTTKYYKEYRLGSSDTYRILKELLNALFDRGHLRILVNDAPDASWEIFHSLAERVSSKRAGGVNASEKKGFYIKPMSDGEDKKAFNTLTIDEMSDYFKEKIGYDGALTGASRTELSSRISEDDLEDLIHDFIKDYSLNKLTGPAFDSTVSLLKTLYASWHKPAKFEFKPENAELTNVKQLYGDNQQGLPSFLDQAQSSVSLRKKYGGIDMNAANLDLQLRRDGKGVILPVSQQDLDNIRIDGLVPVLLDIKPVTGMALFN